MNRVFLAMLAAAAMFLTANTTYAQAPGNRLPDGAAAPAPAPQPGQPGMGMQPNMAGQQYNGMMQSGYTSGCGCQQGNYGVSYGQSNGCCPQQECCCETKHRRGHRRNRC